MTNKHYHYNPNKTSDSIRILNFLYKKKAKFSGKEISKAIDIPLNSIPAKTQKYIAWGLIKKESLNGHWSYYWIPESAKKQVIYRLTKKNIIKENDDSLDNS